ncbi:MAG: hypothetical protein ACI4NM_04665 [Bullifex sp.]
MLIFEGYTYANKKNHNGITDTDAAFHTFFLQQLTGRTSGCHQENRSCRGYSLSRIPAEVKDGTVITFPSDKINGHDYTVTIANRPYSAGDQYTVDSDITLNVLLNHEYTPWTNDGRTVHVRQCTVSGCSQIESGYHTFSNGSCTSCGYR